MHNSDAISVLNCVFDNAYLFIHGVRNLFAETRIFKKHHPSAANLIICFSKVVLFETLELYKCGHVFVVAIMY